MEAVKKETPGGAYVFLSGAIDESASFEQRVGTVQGLLEVNCKGIIRINSIGVKLWVKFFSTLRKGGIRLKFHECSTACMQQFAFFQNFVLPEEVTSVFVPLICDKCSKNEEKCFPIEDLRKAGFQVPSSSCECGGSLILDDTDDYFQALTG